MKLVVPNLPVLNKENPQLGEALKAVESSVNRIAPPTVGNKVAPPPTTVADPTRRPG